MYPCHTAFKSMLLKEHVTKKICSIKSWKMLLKAVNY